MPYQISHTGLRVKNGRTETRFRLVDSDGIMPESTFEYQWLTTDVSQEMIETSKNQLIERVVEEWNTRQSILLQEEEKERLARFYLEESIKYNNEKKEALAASKNDVINWLDAEITDLKLKLVHKIDNAPLSESQKRILQQINIVWNI